MRRFLIAIIKGYQLIISPHLGQCCRFHPSCSCYAREAIERHGPFEISGDPRLMTLMDELLTAFVSQGRMKLPGSRYVPCYRIVT